MGRQAELPPSTACREVGWICWMAGCQRQDAPGARLELVTDQSVLYVCMAETPETRVSCPSYWTMVCSGWDYIVLGGRFFHHWGGRQLVMALVSKHPVLCLGFGVGLCTG